MSRGGRQSAFGRRILKFVVTFFKTTGDVCPRINRWPVLNVPVVQAGQELSQIFTDFRLSDTLEWKEAVIIAEEHTSK